MYQQEHNNVEIINVRFNEWAFPDIVFYILNVIGCCIRLWCFHTLKEFFTFNVTIFKNHKLINTGPYALLIHPSYTGVILMTFNILYVIYQLHYYIPIYSPINFSPFIFNWYCYILYFFFYVYVGIKRILNEEKLLKENFGKEWDLYSKSRKRLIPYLF
ncbi:hypothetical protein C1645_729786 [Glomus cerebriforme]|uniref:Protein-S-isoprenylcysteine O-methyltransferase n=1 Tax=Glomus cerebriforme TaxID=658196 RepID=A0A397S5G8_9GLOM|nr:hypothetical protein C1645_729786 [Glomus cerebriforme]